MRFGKLKDDPWKYGKIIVGNVTPAFVQMLLSQPKPTDIELENKQYAITEMAPAAVVQPGLYNMVSRAQLAFNITYIEPEFCFIYGTVII